MTPKRNGFTLLETLIAMGVLTIGIIGIMQMFPPALLAARQAAERSVIAQLAQSRLGQVKAAGAEIIYRLPSISKTQFLTIDNTQAAQKLYSGAISTIEQLSGASDAYLQRITFKVKFFDDREETFVTYITRQ